MASQNSSGSWPWTIAISVAYYVLCLAVNDWDPLMAGFAWLAMAAFITLLLFAFKGLEHLAESDNNSWVHAGARWANDRLDDDSDSEDDDGD